MLSNYNQSINVSASSTIDGKPVLFMSAAIRSGEGPNINTAYQNMELYNENKAQADEDFEEFKEKVFLIAQY